MMTVNERNRGADMKFVYTEAARRSRVGAAALEEIADRLPNILGPEYSPQATAEWDVITKMSGREIYRLTLSDPLGTASQEFSAEDLVRTPYVTSCLYGLWGDLLQFHVDEAHRNTLRAVAALSASEG